MSNEFIREDRYIVFKKSDVVEHLTTTEMLLLERLYEIQRVGRKEAGKEELECVVVESDWPEYEPTWRAIEARTTGAQPEPSEQDASVRKAWARFSHELHRGPDAPYPGMADAFEQHFSQSFIDREWRAEAATWAAAWKAAKRHGEQPMPSVPDGWKLVPLEPTHEMLDAGEDTFIPTYTGTPVSAPIVVYRAMLAAAPEAKP